MIRSSRMRILWLAPLAFLQQEDSFKKLFAWEAAFAPEQHRAIREVGRWVYSDEGLARFAEPTARELVRVLVKDGVVRSEEKGGVREFKVRIDEGKVVEYEFEGLPWPRVIHGKSSDVAEKDVDRSDPKKTAASLLKVRGEVNRRLQASMSELAKLLPPPELPETTVLSQDADRRFALVYVCHPLSIVDGEIDYRAVRLKMIKAADGWRIDEEGIYCPACADHRKCKSCFGKGIMPVGDSDRALCIGCRPDADCKVCGGAGYVAGFSLLKN